MAGNRIFYNLHASAAIYEAIRALLPPDLELVTLDGPDPEERQSRIAGCEIAVQGSFTFPEALAAAGRELRVVLHEGVGYQDTVDIEALRRRGIRLALTPEGTTTSVAEHTLLLMLAVYRNLVFLDSELRRGRFRRTDFRLRNRTLSGRVAGLVGIGRIGCAVAGRLAAFETTCIYHDPYADGDEIGRRFGARSVSLDELVATADIVSVHAPLTSATAGLIGRSQIARMKPDAIVVSTARGGVIDEPALVEALTEGRILGAGLDVFAEEPLPEGHALARLPNVVLTPHCAGGTLDSLQGRWRAILENVRRYREGEPLNNEVAL